MRKNFLMAALLAILLLSLFLNLYNIDFPLGYHFDELKKVSFIKNYTQDFNHPLLLLQIGRLGNFFFNFSQEQDIAILGRTLTAIFAALIVLLSYFIARLSLNEKNALVVSLAVAVSPIMVVHAHYLKEDIIFTFFALLSLLFLVRLIQRMDNTHAIWLGIAIGLALASKYMGGLFFLILLVVPLIVSSARNRNYVKKIFLSIILSLFVFLIVNYPLFYNFDIFIKGFGYETQHTLIGHFSTKIYALDYLFGFHLINSIIPGITLLPALLALLFIFFALFRWKKTGWQDRIFVLYVLLFYFAAELSPCKPFPDFMRYIIPIIPVMIYFAYKSVLLIASLLQAKGKIVAALLIIMTLALPFVETVQLDYYLNSDTREQARQYLAMAGGNAKYEWHSSIKSDVVSVASLDIEKELGNNVSFFVASSFMYDAFALGSTLKNQGNYVYETQEKYLALFNNYPFIEFKPAYKSFAFSNPTIRVIDIRQNRTQVH